MKTKKCELDQKISERFASSTRTVRRWRKRGVNLENDLAIVEHIVSSRSPTNATLSACKAILESNQPKK